MEKTESRWGTRYRFGKEGNGHFDYPTILGYTTNLLLKGAGALIMYKVGDLVGEYIMNHAPEITASITEKVNNISGIDIKNNLDSLLGILGGLSGFSQSGIELDSYTRKIRKVKLAILPFLTYERE